ncbi:MAG TPA: hypothetical protein PKI64_09735, partial [Kiritimatiellia bacterium]|nr:hypothetical protein [Kiritimatiellia bacterium]
LPHEKRNKSDSRLLSVPPFCGKVESKLFHCVEKYSLIFPHRGTFATDFFTVWKKVYPAWAGFSIAWKN